MVRGFPGLAGDITAVIGKALWPVWALARLLMHLTTRLGDIKRKRDEGERQRF